MEPIKTHGATCDAVDNATAGTFPSPEVTASLLGESDAVDRATAGTFPSPEVTASTQGELVPRQYGTDIAHHQDTSIESEVPTSYISREVALRNFLDKSRMRYSRGRPPDLNASERLEVIYELFGDKLKGMEEIEEYKQKLLGAVAIFITKAENKYHESKRNMTLFKRKKKAWLIKPFFDDLPNEVKLSSITSFSSPRTTKYLALSQRQQRRQRKSLAERLTEEPPTKLVRAFTEAITLSSSSSDVSHKTSSKEMELIINTCIENPQKAIDISTQIKNSDKVTKPQSYTPEEALAFIIDANISVNTYKFMRQDLLRRGFPAYPPYQLVLGSKSLCYPKSELQVSEFEASVSLQGLMDHTFDRIIQTIDPVIVQYCEQNGISQMECTFEVSWGFDGSSGQSLYKQKYSQEHFDENCLFTTTLVPLRISHGKNNIWINPCPQSYRSCRPLHVQYRKETPELILSEKKSVEAQISQLGLSFAYTSKNQFVTAKPLLTLCMIDGKALNVITNTKSPLTCPICKLSASDFNNLDLAYAVPPDETSLKYGISPLHAWIRVLEFLLHLSYKNDPAVKMWRVRRNTPQGKIIEKRKAQIQNHLKDQLGLLVDVVKPTAGTTNDGNTARMALNDKNRKKFAEILELDLWLVDSLYYILVTINCGLPVDSTKFGQFCKDIAVKYVTTYGWHPMTATVHKILIHGEQIIDNSTLPVGLLSEQAAESRNKFWRSDREHHARKIERQKTMLDLFNRALESSDPVIANVRLAERKKNTRRLPLPQQVRMLLKEFEDIQNDEEVIDEDNECILENPIRSESQDTLVLHSEGIIYEDDAM